MVKLAVAEVSVESEMLVYRFLLKQKCRNFILPSIVVVAKMIEAFDFYQKSDFQSGKNRLTVLSENPFQ